MRKGECRTRSVFVHLPVADSGFHFALGFFLHLLAAFEILLGQLQPPSFVLDCGGKQTFTSPSSSVCLLFTVSASTFTLILAKKKSYCFKELWRDERLNVFFGYFLLAFFFFCRRSFSAGFFFWQTSGHVVFSVFLTKPQGNRNDLK